MSKIKKVSESSLTNGANEALSFSLPYTVRVSIQGSSDFLFHRWNCEAVDAKSSAAKGSKAKKTDNIESYVYRNDKGELCIPGEYLRMSIIAASKFKQDPRSPRKSAMDLHKAAVISLTPLSSLGTKQWDYEDKRRVVVQRSGINRIRPAMKSGWVADFDILVNIPEYISPSDLYDTISLAGRLIGMGDFRPTFGRFQIIGFNKLT